MGECQVRTSAKVAEHLVLLVRALAKRSGFFLSEEVVYIGTQSDSTFALPVDSNLLSDKAELASKKKSRILVVA